MHQKIEKMSRDGLSIPTIPVVSFRFRREFHCASKNNNETVSDWYIRLKLLANSCQFGNEADHFVLDKFVIGLGDDLFERMCMENGYLSLEQSIELASQIETASGGLVHGSEEVKLIEDICDTRTAIKGFKKKTSLERNVDAKSLETKSVIEVIQFLINVPETKDSNEYQ